MSVPSNKNLCYTTFIRSRTYIMGLDYVNCRVETRIEMKRGEGIDGGGGVGGEDLRSLKHVSAV
jgi:hypothetical protein